jgi:hypothetical protein
MRSVGMGNQPWSHGRPGKRHLLYRYNGEGHRIRPWPELPINVLGDNGYTLAAPSKLATGNYEIIHGHLDDLDRLKPMQSGLVQSARHGGVLVPKGGAESGAVRSLRQAARYCDSLEALIDCATTYRDNRLAKDPTDPITDAEVIKTPSPAWKMQIEGRNWIGQGGIIPMRFAEVDRFLNLGEDATFLFLHLERHHNERMPWPNYSSGGLSASRMRADNWSKQACSASSNRVAGARAILRSMLGAMASSLWGSEMIPNLN